jgi:hypothetical protein
MKVLRIRRLCEAGNPARHTGAQFGGPSVDLRGGNLYELDILVIRTVEEPEPITLSVTPPRGCAMVGPDEVALTSRYDKATFRFFSEARDNPVVGEMAVRAVAAKRKHPTQPTQTGEPVPKVALTPEARFQVRTVPRRFLALSAYFAAVLTALAAFFVALIGQRGVYLGSSVTPVTGDKAIELSVLVAWFGGGSLSVSTTALAVAAMTGLSAGGAALLVLIRKRYGLTT